ncbi:aminotransferase class V-fold PLP-dependent enzyme [soil metagenome]
MTPAAPTPADPAASPDWARVRRRYPAALRKTYLDTAHRGIPAPATVEAVRRFCDVVRTSPAQTATGDTVELMDSCTRARVAVAGLINASSDEIALVESTQQGLAVAADLLGLGPGDTVVTDDLEFAGSVLPFRGRGTRGVAIRLVLNRHGALDVADFADAIDASTRAVVVSSVQEVNGYRLDLAALGNVCRDRGVRLVVDGIQHVGPVPFDVRRTPVDFLAVGAHKWLCSPFGLGFLYVRAGLLDELEPRSRGHTSIAEPAGGWDAYVSDPRRSPVEELCFAGGARKFEVAGTPNFAGALALAAAVGVLADLGPAAVAERVSALSGLLADGLTDVGMTLAAPHDTARSSGIVTFRSSRTADDDRALLGALVAAGVSVGIRYSSGVGGIRTATHLYNDESDVDRLLDVVRRRRRRRPATGPHPPATSPHPPPFEG